MPNKASQKQPDETLRAQYELTSQSLDQLGMALAAVLVNYHAVELKKQQLESALIGQTCEISEEMLFWMEMVAAVMLLSVGSFFFGVAEDALKTPAPTAALQQNLQVNSFLNAQVLLAATARIYGLLLVRNDPDAQSLAADEATVEDSSPL